MNDNKTFSTTTTINIEDYMLSPYNDHYSSQPLLPFSPFSSINDILIHSISNTSNNHLDCHHHHHHHHQFLQTPSPFSHFESVPDFALLASLLPQNNGHNDNQTITTSDHHYPPSLLPLNNPIGESPLIEPSVTITTHIEDSHRISTSQDPKTKKVKKPSRTDRHSKIKTAKGTRDRRMRLSLDVAKELFGLQDMLGFDKASKTVEWLLTQAKPQIIKIARSFSNQFNHGRFISCEESQTRPALGLMDTSSDLCELASMWTVEDRGRNTNTTEKRGNKVDGRSVRGKRRMSQPRTPILKKLSRDARAKARDRAKYRTKEKMMKRSAQVNFIVEEEVHNHHDEIVLKNNKSNLKATPCEEKIQEPLCKNDRFAVCNEFVMDKKDHISDEFSSSFLMLDHHRSQWADSSIEQHRQFADLHHFLGKPRDLVYNYHSMC